VDIESCYLLRMKTCLMFLFSVVLSSISNLLRDLMSGVNFR